MYVEERRLEMGRDEFLRTELYWVELCLVFETCLREGS